MIRINNVEIDEKDLLAMGWNPPEPKCRQRVGERGYYYFIDGCGGINSERDTAYSVDDFRFSRGNYYPTEEEAEEASAKQLATQRVIDALEIANGWWVADWKDHGQTKCNILYNHEEMKFCTEFYCRTQASDTRMIGSKEAWESVIKSHEADLKIMFGVGE